MAGDVAAARMAAQVAAADAPGSADADTCKPMAASRSSRQPWPRCAAGEAATRGAGIAHQVHGAIGFTHEHALHFATRRLWAWRDEFGSDARLGRRVGPRRHRWPAPAGFWPAITGRHFT